MHYCSLTHPSTYVLILLAIFSTASNAQDIICEEATTRPRLSYSGCREAAIEFNQRYPSRTDPTLYFLTHRGLFLRRSLKCPLVIERPGCVLTLDYAGAQSTPIHPLLLCVEIATEFAFHLARRCVDKTGTYGPFDGGEVIWSGIGGYGTEGTANLWLWHTARPMNGLDINITSSRDFNGTLEAKYPGARSRANLTTVGDVNGTFEALDAK